MANETIQELTKELATSPSASSVLLRRALAYEKNQEFDKAFQDLKQVLAIEPKNSEALERIKTLSRTELAFNTDLEKEEKRKHLLHLSNDESFAIKFLADYGLEPLLKIKVDDTVLSIIYNLLKVEQKRSFLEELKSMQIKDEYMPKWITLLGLEMGKISVKSEALKPIFEDWIKLFHESNLVVKKALYSGLISSLSDEPKALTFFNLKHETFLMAVDEETKALCASLMARLFSSINNQKTLVERYYNMIETLINDNKSKPTGLLFLSLIFQVEPSVGSQILKKNNMLKEIMEIAEFESDNVKCNLLETLSASCSDPDTRKLVSAECVDFLFQCARQSSKKKQCSLASLTLIKIMSLNKAVEQHILEQNRTAFFFTTVLSNKELDSSGRSTALEALAYLSVHPKIKQLIAADEKLFKLLLIFANSDRPCQYGLALILMNLTSYPKTLTKEEKDLAKLSKMALPNAPEKSLETPEQISKRIDCLVSQKIIPCLISLGRVPAINTQEAVAAAILSISNTQKHRGALIQAGACRLLLNFTSRLGKDAVLNACQALAKIGITNDPSLAFRGEMAFEVVRPLMFLCDSDNGLHQFEALMALTNLAGMNDDIRHRIMQVDGLKKIEHLQFSDNEMIRRAATEALCNMISNQSVYEKYLEPESSRIKIMVALCDSEDFETRRAASGAVAMISSSKYGAQALSKQNRFYEILKDLALDKSPELQHRAVETIKNLCIENDEHVKDFIPIVVAMAKHPMQAIASSAQEALRSFSK